MANSRKKNRRRKVLSTVLIVLAVLIALAAVGVKLLRQRITDTYGAKSSDTAKTATVIRGSISTTISGSGTLAAQESSTVMLPTGVLVKSLCVEKGDLVAEGDKLANLDLSSILSAMNELKETLDDLDEDIAAAAKETVSSTIKSPVAGRVKAIHGQSGDSVLSVMYSNGALLTLSLDGYMALDIPAGSLAAGDKVTVTLSDGTAYPGVTDTLSEGKATVLITDNKPPLGDEATVTDESGQSLGTAPLYIHKPLNITGYAGTVSRLLVTENMQVTKNRILLYLTDTAYTATYDALLKERRELEADLNELISLYTTGAIFAPTAGKVESITEEPAAEEEGEDPILAVVRPQDTMTVNAYIDESNILAVELGQEAAVTISSISSDPFTGSVTSVEKAGTSSNGVTSYAVEVTLARTEQMLSNMSATVSIRIEGVDNALLLPEGAVTRTRDSAYIYTAVNETTGELEGMAEVKTGLTGGGYIEITSGLSEGDKVFYTEKQSTDFSSFMGGFNGGGSNRPSGNGGSGGSGGSGNRRPRSGQNGGQP